MSKSNLNLSTLVCKNHNRKAIQACTDLNCKENIFVCDQCKNTHSHNNDEIHNITDFPSRLYYKLKPILENQEFQRLNFNNQEQNQHIYKFLTNPLDFDQWLQYERTQFSHKINEKIDTFVRKLNQIKEEELKKFDQQYRKQFKIIQQNYESAFRYQQEYCVQSPTAFFNRILQFGDPETYLRNFKPINQINLTPLTESIKQFDQLKNINNIFQPNAQRIIQSQNLDDTTVSGQNNVLQNVDKTIIKAKNTGMLLDWEAETRVRNTSQQQTDIIDSKANQKYTLQPPEQNQHQKQNAKLIIPKTTDNYEIPYNRSEIVLAKIRYEEIKPSLLQGQGVRIMIFLQADLIIYGTDEKLFSLKNSQQLQQIPLQFDYISCLDKLDNNSFIVGGTTKQGYGVVYKYIKSQLDQFQALIVFKIQGDILTMIGISKESIAFVTSEKQKNRDIKYTLYYCKYLGIPNQFLINQDLGQSKKKKIKIYNMQDNQFCLHLINEYISVIQVNEKLKIFQEIKKVDCFIQGSVIPLVNELFLFSACVNEEKIENKIINLNQNVSGLTGEYVYQIKSDVLDNFITVLQITEKGKLFIIIIDKYMPIEIDVFNDLGQLNIELEQSFSYNLLVHFMDNMLFIKDAKTDAVKIFKIHLHS